MSGRETLAAFLDRHDAVCRVAIDEVRGSSPRDAGTTMIVSATGTFGTIGGGQLEYMAIDQARGLLGSGRVSAVMDVPLGPEIGQCCGGRVRISLTRLDDAARSAAVAREAADRSAWPRVLIFGAGHVGRALAHSFERLPVRAVLIDGREDEMASCRASVEKCLTPLPEAEIRAAPPGSAFVVLTHDHALDFLLTSEALARDDAAYVGMIGSATKRAKFARFCEDLSPPASLRKLTCPIGSAGSADKRPEVIAAFVAAEIMEVLTTVTDRQTQSIS
jgi:xanthine dehydrogenase accessory factor